MKRIQGTFGLYMLAIMLGGLAFSCTRYEESVTVDTHDGSEYGEEGMLSVVLFANTPNASARAQGSGSGSGDIHINFTEEDRVKDVRIILYGATNGKAMYIKDYDLENGNSSDWANRTPPYYQTGAFEVKRGKYKLAVLVNYNNEWIFYKDNRNQDASDVEHRTRDIGHHWDELTETPLDFSVNASDASHPGWGNYKARAFTMQTLAGVYDNRPYKMTFNAYGDWDDYDFSIWKDNAFFFMSNADGLVDINPEHIKPDEGSAEASPVSVRVERALAKLAFFLSPDFSLSPYFEVQDGGGGDMTRASGGPGDGRSCISARWAVDVHNMKVYPIRKQADVAPSAGGTGMTETTETRRIDRYAKDPNMNIVSGSPDAKGEFYLLPDDPDEPDPMYQDLFSENTGNLNGNIYALSSIDEIKDEATSDVSWLMDNASIEYIPENSIESGSGIYTDVVTNIVMKVDLRYKFRYAYNSGETEDKYWYETSGSFFVYKDIIYPADIINDWLYGDENYLYKDFILDREITLDALKEDFNTPEKINELKDKFYTNYGWYEMIPGELEVTDSEGIEQIIRCYNGKSFYRIPIPHFKENQSPGPIDSYGRYGVVRNNTYVLLLEAINTVGSPIYPKPGKVDESDNKSVSVTGIMLPWIARREDYSLGE